MNRVQETHQNGYDDSMLTDIYSLDRLYNDEDNTLDIERIAAMDSSAIHVGAEYFILRKETKGYAPDSIKIKKRKIKELACRLTRFPKRIHRHFERKSYEKGRYADRLHILNTDETLALMERENQHFAITDSKDEYMGTISLKHISEADHNAEYAIVTRKKAHGTGLAERATMEILKYAFNDLGLHRVYLTVLSDNIAARKLYENCGFDLEGELKDVIRLGGRYRDQACYAILNWKEKTMEGM